MAETSETSHPDRDVAEKKGFFTYLLDWGYRALLGLCALPALLSTVLAVAYFAHSASGHPSRLVEPTPAADPDIEHR